MRSLNCSILRPNGDPLFLVPHPETGEQQMFLASKLVIDTDPDGPNYQLVMDPANAGRAILRFPDCAPRGQGGTLEVWWPGLYSGPLRIVTPTQAEVEMGQEGGDSEILMWDYAHYA